MASLAASTPAMTGTPPASPSVFDPADLDSNGLLARLTAWVLEDPRIPFAMLRRVAPVAKLGNWAFISRYDDVRQALRDDAFVEVPFGAKVTALNDGPNFLLGMSGGEDYRWLRDITAAAFPRAEVASVVAPLARRHAEAIVGRSAGRLDAVQNLLTLVPTRICEDYYGVAVPDEIAFGKWTIAMSSYAFGDPGNNPRVARAALAASGLVRPLVDAAIAKARGAPDGPDTIAARLVRAQAQDARLTDAHCRAILTGMITGFVPTNTMASGHMLEMLLRRPAMLRGAQHAVRAGDDELLERCLFEAMRFMPLNPGPFRVIAEDYVAARGKPHARLLPKGTKVCVGTQSAMFDPRKIVSPDTFEPSRPEDNYLMFGHGMHACIGEAMARAQITQTFKPLLAMRNLRRAPGQRGRLSKIGPFPAHLEVAFDLED